MAQLIFVYAKDKKVKILDLDQSKQQNDSLISDGWKHTATLDPCVFISYLINDCEHVDILDEFKELKHG